MVIYWDGKPMPLSLEEIGLSVLHAGYQFGIGIVAGSVLDYVFGHYLEPVAAYTDDPKILALSAIEIVGQIAASALIAASLFNAMVTAPQADPAAGFAISITLSLSQPILAGKIVSFARSIRMLAGMEEAKTVTSTAPVSNSQRQRTGPSNAPTVDA